MGHGSTAKHGTIICYGDSNTYGYDPADRREGRYPKEVRWTGILDMEGGYAVRNHGVCGRVIPRYAGQIEFVKSQLERWSLEEPPVYVWIMLGTNDLLTDAGLGARGVASRMEVFLRSLMAEPAVEGGSVSLRLIAPPPMKVGSWTGDGNVLRESENLGCAYRETAGRLGVPFTDAGLFGVSLVFDGVHFSEEGHRRMAEGMLKVI